MFNKPGSATRTSNTSMYAPNRRRRLSPLMIIGISIPVLLVLIGAGVIVAMPKLFSKAATTPAVPNPNCTLIVPANPLSAKGLATPYQLVGTAAAANGPCNESNVNQSAFVQAGIFDVNTNTFSIYPPLIIDQGTAPGVVPTPPVLPPGAVVGLWFGFNGTNLNLQGANGNTLNNAKCVNGLPGSVFGQFAYCNAVNFFKSVNAGIAGGKVTIPPLGMALDGQTCPSLRSPSVGDMDPDDNVQTQYLANGAITLQNTAANRLLFPNATPIANPSDNALTSAFIDPTLGCKPFTAPDLANAGAPTAALPLDELQAAAFQQAPVNLVPLGDEMVTVGAAVASPQKDTLYRLGVDQPPVNANNAVTSGSTKTYCTNLLSAAGLGRIKGDMTLTVNATSPAPAAANSLFTFLAMRFNQAYTFLNCAGLTGVPQPVALTMTGNIVTAATITLPAAGTTTGTGTGTTTGTTTQTATGTATMNLDTNAGNATFATTVTYPNHPNTQVTASIVSNTGATVFTQTFGTDNNSQATFNSAINGLQGLTALPSTWTFNLTDMNLNTVVGSGTVVANGTTATATLGTLTTTATATTATANAATANAATTSVTSPAAPASAGQVNGTNAPYSGVAKGNVHFW